MTHRYPIYVVDDDIDEKEIIQEVWNQLGLQNKLVFFTNGGKLIDQLKQDDDLPFIIICDLNLPKMDGFQIRQKLYEDPETRYKSVPFIFWSNSASEEQIKKAYDLSAHGMFIKGSSFDEIKQTFTKIINYWQDSLKPK